MRELLFYGKIIAKFFYRHEKVNDMKTYGYDTIADALSGLIREKLCTVEKEALLLTQAALEKETCPAAAWALETIVENANIARENRFFACQDCGIALVFAYVGRNARLDCDLTEAINEGVRRGYRDARKSVADPLTRLNTGDNTPAVIYTEIVEGDGLTLEWMAKGAGSENMSAVYMLTPSKGEDGIVQSAVDCVKKAGANPCPPVILGIGVGGTMDKAAVLSKKALMRNTGEPSPDPQVAKLEKRILDAVNALKTGAQGLKGDTTALAVQMETFPTHIGMLPVAITIQCHSVRHGKITL